MPKRKMYPPSQSTGLDKLKEYWNFYGHSIKWEDLIDYRMRGDECYVVVAWREKNGEIGMADLARGGRSLNWDMQNDAYIEITEEEWLGKMYIPDACDWFVVPGNDHYPSMA